MTTYEHQLAAALEDATGKFWYLAGASNSRLTAYAEAPDVVSRETVVRNMQLDAINHAHRVLQAALHAGIVSVPSAAAK